MIRVEIESEYVCLRLGDNRKKLICPYCGHRHYFYYYSPRECEGCNKDLPDAIFMLDDINGRFEYHKTGMARLDISTGGQK